jgi:hypothetical protein
MAMHSWRDRQGTILSSCSKQPESPCYPIIDHFLLAVEHGTMGMHALKLPVS